MTVNRTPTLAFVCLWLFLCASATPAFARITDVLARGSDAFWLLRTDIDKDNVETTTVRRQADPITGRWVESGRVAGRVADAASVDGRLAVLSVDGSWRLVWDGGSVNGPAAPDHRLMRLASFGTTLWAVGKPLKDDGRLDLLSWTEAAGWKIAGPLPTDVDGPSMTLEVVGDTAWLAWVDHDGVRAARWEGGRWAEPFRPLARGKSAAFVSGSPRPLLAVRTEDDKLALWRPDAWPPSEARTPINLPLPASLTAVGPTIRAIAVRDDKLEQSSIDDFGRGDVSKPVPVPDPTPGQPRPFEFINLLVLALLTVAMLRSMRSPDAVPMIAAGLRPAPVWRRTGAGLIDAVPFIVASVFAFIQFEGTNESLKHTPVTFYLPIYLGLMLYIAHVTACEAWRGRSIGKAIFRLKVVSTDGSEPSFGQVLVRNLMRILELTPLGILALLPLISPAGQRLGDMAAKTVVVTEAPGDVPAEGASSPSDSL